MKTILLSLISLATFAQTGRTVTLTWLDSQNPAGTTYNVYRASGLCSGTPAFSKIATAVSAKTFSDPGLTTGTFCYTVTATNGSIESAQAVPASATITPFTPSGLAITIQ